MRLKEFMRLTGASHRQIDYWSKKVPLVKSVPEHEGSGYWREYDEEVIPRVRVMVAISSSFARVFSVDILASVFEDYYEGRIRIAEGVYLSWDVVNDGTYGAPTPSFTISRER